MLPDTRYDPPAAVRAVLIDGVTREAARRTDELWGRALGQLLHRASQLGVPSDLWPEHEHWTWDGKIRHANASNRFYGIECERQMRGMLALRTDNLSRMAGSPALPIVYVDYLSTAPWNQQEFLSSIGEIARFRGCGIALMTVSITLSRERGYNGRVGLHSLIGAESFYRDKCGMTDLGIDPTYEDLRYFEMTHDQASDFLRRLKV